MGRVDVFLPFYIDSLAFFQAEPALHEIVRLCDAAPFQGSVFILQYSQGLAGQTLALLCEYIRLTGLLTTCVESAHMYLNFTFSFSGVYFYESKTFSLLTLDVLIDITNKSFIIGQ